MPPTGNVANLTLEILEKGQSTDADELDRLTRQLRGELEELGVESVDLLKDKPAPQGTKSAEAVTLGALAVAVLPNALHKLIEFLNGWLMRGENRKIKIKTQVGDRSVEVEYSPKTMSQTELKSLVDTLTGALTEKK